MCPVALTLAENERKIWMRTTHKYPSLLTINENDLSASIAMSSLCVSLATALMLVREAHWQQSLLSVESVCVWSL